MLASPKIGDAQLAMRRATALARVAHFAVADLKGICVIATSVDSSGSSGAGGRGQANRVSSLARAAPYQQQAARQRRTEDASPLMRRDANYAYSDDGDSD